MVIQTYQTQERHFSIVGKFHKVTVVIKFNGLRDQTPS